MKNSHSHLGSANGSTRVGLLLGLIAGVAVTGFLLLDPLGLHPLDDRLRAAAGHHHTKTGTTETEPGLWTCGMHPNVIQDKPGLCPICQMDLVPLNRPSTPGPATLETTTWTCPVHDVIAEGEAGRCPICDRDLVPEVDHGTHADAQGSSSPDSGHEVTLDPGVIQKMNVRTVAVERRDLTSRIETVGNLDYDEEHMVSITTRYSGFIERVFANHVGQPVRRNDPLFEVYSPDLVQTQRELIAAVEYARQFEGASPDVRSRADALVDAARTRLEYWEVSPERVSEIIATGEIHRTLTVFAPADGVIMQRMHGLDGMAISPGMELMHIADLSSLWLRVEVYEHHLPWLDLGSTANVTFDYLPGEAFSGRIRYVEPEVAPETRTVTLTLEVPNPTGLLRVGMFATVAFNPLVAPDALVVPSQAVIRSGRRNIAVVALEGGRFSPREIELGVEANGLAQVLDGLSDGDEIVTSAQFLIDSESNLRAAISSLLASRSGHQH